MTASDSFVPPGPLNTAVLFLVFNRPEVTAQVFEAIRKARPPRLYVAADGPRAGREGEAERCAQVRRIATAVDWPCEVKTLFREKNLGCKNAVSGGISWFFEHEEQGIILEDDCLPSQSFFWFCEILLIKYKNDERIGQISGYNGCDYSSDSIYDYEFMTGGSIWGWATWKRVANSFINFFNEDIDQIYKSMVDFTDDIKECRHIKKNLTLVKEGKLSTWDYHWGSMLKANSQMSAVSSKNLIENIGFGPEATHTTGNYFGPSLREIDVCNVRHPKYISPNKRKSKTQADLNVGSIMKIISFKINRFIK